MSSIQKNIFTSVYPLDNENGQKQIKLSFAKVPFLKVIEEKSDEITLSVMYRKKASIKEYPFKLKIKENEVPTFFQKYNTFKLENYFININQVIFVESENQKGKSKIVFYFSDGQHLEIITYIPRWEAWKTNRL